MVDLKHKIPENFIAEEIRCGYKVTQQMKEVWAVQLDLFAEFDRVCRKYGIKYVASGGTLLGAVRHHGYIPWDDDIDIMLMRDQYNKLCQVASVEFKHPYFFQIEETEPGFHRWFARLRNSETTAIQEVEKPYHFKYNQGIFIDIFPMDNVADDRKRNIQQREIRYYKSIYYKLLAIERSFWSDNESPSKRWAKKTAHFLFGKLIRHTSFTRWAWHKVDETFQLYNNEKTEFVSLLSFEFDNLNHAVRSSYLNDIIEVEFEFLKMPIFASYDEHLKLKYGDYMTPSKNPNYHGDVMFDTNASYKEHLQLK